MSQTVLIIVLLSILIHADVDASSDHILEANWVFVDNINDYKTNNPQLLLFPLNKVGNGKQGIKYTVGQRVAGDRLISTLAENHNWVGLQNVALTLTYPKSGYGNIVSYVQININQVNLYIHSKKINR